MKITAFVFEHSTKITLYCKVQCIHHHGVDIGVDYVHGHRVASLVVDYADYVHGHRVASLVVDYADKECDS